MILLKKEVDNEFFKIKLEIILLLFDKLGGVDKLVCSATIPKLETAIIELIKSVI